MTDEKTLFKRVYRYLSIRSRSEQEIRDYLKRKKASLDQIETIIDSLKNQKFINDEDFIDEYIRSYKNKGVGPRKIYFNLLKKGLGKDEINQKINSINDQEWIDSATLIVEKKSNQIKKLDKYKQRQKIYQILAYRGHKGSVIKSIIDAFLHLE